MNCAGLPRTFIEEIWMNCAGLPRTFIEEIHMKRTGLPWLHNYSILVETPSDHIRRMKMKQKLTSLLVIAFLCAACASQQTPTKLPAEATSASPSSTALAPESPAISTALAEEPTVAPIQTPYAPFTITNTVENAVLRAG